MNAETVPLLSIGMPVYNGERYVADAIESLLAQTFTDFELIISDNASSDGTESICRTFAQKDSRIHYHRHKQNRGAYWNFNKAFRMSKGKYFKWASHDDVCAPEYLARCVEALENDPNIACCHSYTGNIGVKGEPLPELPDPTDGGIVLRSGVRRCDASSPQMHLRFHDVLLVTGWGVRLWGMYPRRYLEQTGLMRTFYGSEKLMMAELCAMGYFHDVPEQLFFRRTHPQASSSQASGALQMKFSNPRRNKWQFPLLRKLKGYLQVPFRPNIRIKDRMLCYLWIGKYLFQVRKWIPVFVNWISGRGVKTTQ